MHKLQIKYRSHGFSAMCSCGKRIASSRGCNRAGIAYGKVAAWGKYVQHCAEIGAKPAMHHDFRGLAGVKP